MKIYDFRAVEAAGGFCRAARPHFSWKLKSDERDTVQTKYALTVLCEGVPVQKASGEGESVYILPEGEELASRTGYEAHLTVSDNHGNTDECVLSFETDKLSEPFTAKMIAPKEQIAPVYALKGKFTAKKPVKRARLYATALGLYECYVGENKAGDSYFAPFWTSYHHALEYQTYDVTSLVKEGENDFAMLIGKGWYAGKLGFMSQSCLYGDRTAGMAELHLTYVDGSEDVFVTDETFTASTCFISDSEFYMGETQDFTAETKTCPVETVDYLQLHPDVRHRHRVRGLPPRPRCVRKRVGRDARLRELLQSLFQRILPQSLPQYLRDGCDEPFHRLPCARHSGPSAFAGAL